MISPRFCLFSICPHTSFFQYFLINLTKLSFLLSLGLVPGAADVVVGGGGGGAGVVVGALVPKHSMILHFTINKICCSPIFLKQQYSIKSFFKNILKKEKQ